MKRMKRLSALACARAAVRCAGPCAGPLSDPHGPARGRLRRRRPDRHSGALRRRQARHAARPAHDRREQDRRRRHAGDARRAGAAGRRLQPPALHALRVDQHGALQEPGLQARRPRADFADREILLRPRASPTPFRPTTSNEFVQYAKAHPGEISYATHRRRLGAGDHGAAARKARRHHDEPHPVPQRLPGDAGPDRRAACRCIVSPTIGVVPQHHDKQLKILATTSPQRLKGMADVPTLKEKGIDYVRYGFLGICAAEGHAAADPRSAQPPYRRRSWRRRTTAT